MARKLTRDQEKAAIEAYMAAHADGAGIDDTDDTGDGDDETPAPPRKAVKVATLPPTYNAGGFTVYPGPSGTIVLRAGMMTCSLYPPQWVRLYGGPEVTDGAMLRGFAETLAKGSPDGTVPRGVATFLRTAATLGEDGWKAACRARALASGRYAEGEDGALVPVKGRAKAGRASGPRW